MNQDDKCNEQTTLTLSMSKKDKYDLKAYALQKGISVSELIRQWLNEHLN